MREKRNELEQEQLKLSGSARFDLSKQAPAANDPCSIGRFTPRLLSGHPDLTRDPCSCPTSLFLISATNEDFLISSE